MVALIVLNIILIIILAFLLMYLFGNKKDNDKHVYINEEKNSDIKNVKCENNKPEKYDRVFEGRVITDEEYQQMVKLRRSDISILLEEVKREYEHLKELNK